jgi:hypothetical protein
MGLQGIGVVALNGAALPVVVASPTCVELVVASELWRAGALNELTIAWPAAADSASPVLTGIVARSATSPA